MYRNCNKKPMKIIDRLRKVNCVTLFEKTIFFLPGEMETGGIPPLKNFAKLIRTFFAMSFRQEVLSGHFCFETSLRTLCILDRKREEWKDWRGSVPVIEDLLCARQVSVKPLYCICYCLVMFSVHLCVHYILYCTV